MLFSVFLRSERLLLIELSAFWDICTTGCTYRAVCKYFWFQLVFLFMFLVSWIMHLVEDKYISNRRVFVSLLPFVTTLKDPRHDYPLTVSVCVCVSV